MMEERPAASQELVGHVAAVRKFRSTLRFVDLLLAPEADGTAELAAEGAMPARVVQLVLRDAGINASVKLSPGDFLRVEATVAGEQQQKGSPAPTFEVNTLLEASHDPAARNNYASVVAGGFPTAGGSRDRLVLDPKAGKLAVAVCRLWLRGKCRDGAARCALRHECLTPQEEEARTRFALLRRRAEEERRRQREAQREAGIFVESEDDGAHGCVFGFRVRRGVL